MKNYSFQNPPLAALAETVKKAFKNHDKNRSLIPFYWDQGNTGPNTDHKLQVAFGTNASENIADNSYFERNISEFFR